MKGMHLLLFAVFSMLVVSSLVVALEPSFGKPYLLKKVSSCQDLTQSNARYILSKDLILPSQQKSCLNVLANNVIIDCQGHSITDSGNVYYGAVGIVATGRHDVEIRNCLIDVDSEQGAAISSGKYSMYIHDNSIRNSFYGIHASEANTTIIDNNNFLYINGAGIVFSTTKLSKVTNNDFQDVTKPIALSSNANNNLIQDNTMMYGSYPISLYGACSNNVIERNTMQYFQGHGMYFYDRSDNNQITNNVITNAGENGVNLVGSSNNVFKSMAISGSGGNGIYSVPIVGDDSHDNTFQNVSSLYSGLYDVRMFGPHTKIFFIDSLFGMYSFVQQGTSFSLGSMAHGRIEFTQKITLEGYDLFQELTITHNNASITHKPELEKSAIVTLYNMPGNYNNPAIYRDGKLCAGQYPCTPYTSLNDKTVIFAVPAAGTYWIGEKI